MSIAVVCQVTSTHRPVSGCWSDRPRMLAGMLTAADDLLAHWNTRLFHWNTCANPSVPDQMCTQRPDSHNAHIFSVIGDGRKILEHWNTHIRQSSSGPPDRRRRRGVAEGVWRRSLRRHSLFTCLKNVVVSVPAFQSGGDLGESGRKPVQTNFQAI